MADEPAQPDEQRPWPPEVYSLDYAPPETGATSRKIASMIGGLFLSSAVLLFVGAVCYPYSIVGPPARPPEPRAWPAVAAWLVLAVGAMVGAAFLLGRRPLVAARWFVMGLLIGTGLVALLEGACYANP